VGGGRVGGDSPSGVGCVGVVPRQSRRVTRLPWPDPDGRGRPDRRWGRQPAVERKEPTVPPVNYTPDWSLFQAADGLATKG